MRHFTRYVASLTRWIAEPKHFWLAILVSLAVLALSLQLARTLDDGLRYAGLALQLLGVSTVVVGLEARRRLFERASFASTIRTWWAHRPKWSPGDISLSAEINIQGNLSISGDIEIWSSDDPLQTPEHRLTAVVRNQETIRRRLSSIHSASTQGLSQLKQAMSQHLDQQQTKHQQLSGVLEKLGAESITFEFVGLAWLVSGIVLATIPSEIAALLLQAQ